MSNDVFDEVKNMKPLAERQAAVREKINALPDDVGPKVLELLTESKHRDDLKHLVLQATFGRDLWDEYWAVHRDTVEQAASEFFAKMDDAKRKREAKGIF